MTYLCAFFLCSDLANCCSSCSTLRASKKSMTLSAVTSSSSLADRFKSSFCSSLVFSFASPGRFARLKALQRQFGPCALAWSSFMSVSFISLSLTSTLLVSMLPGLSWLLFWSVNKLICFLKNKYFLKVTYFKLKSPPENRRIKLLTISNMSMIILRKKSKKGFELLPDPPDPPIWLLCCIIWFAWFISSWRTFVALVRVFGGIWAEGIEGPIGPIGGICPHDWFTMTNKKTKASNKSLLNILNKRKTIKVINYFWFGTIINHFSRKLSLIRFYRNTMAIWLSLKMTTILSPMHFCNGNHQHLTVIYDPVCKNYHSSGCLYSCFNTYAKLNRTQWNFN